MYLKKLSLKGFKSFPIKTDIIFEQGITAIVGPNGSGKSNISDAIRWVLGEQSVKSLRGEKMEDVIFSGTDNKKQHNYCEVTLTLDNSLGEIDVDSNELVVKRRVYRTGESEYYINQKSCRLKDVKETLMDTGIGKDGYSIIEQGKVDELLSPNLVNRRKVFDEACGIAKYRYRKTEAEKNLNKASDNLTRIVDIFSEIEKQLEPLEKQQEKAKKYITISDELKKYEVNEIIIKNTDLENSINDIGFQLNEVNKEFCTLDSQKDALEKEVSKLESDLSSIEEYIEDKGNQIVELNSSINLNKRDFEITKANIKNIKHDIERKTNEISIINSRLEVARVELKKSNDKSDKESYVIEEVEKSLEEIFENKRKLEKILESINKSIENSNKDSVELLKTKESISNSITKYTSDIENMDSKQDDIEKNIEKYKTTIIELEKTIEEKNKEKIEKENKIISLNADILSFKKELESIQSNIKNMVGTSNKENMKLGSLNAKRNTYIEMENHHEGFNKGVKEILKNKNIQGIHGAFGELIKVSKSYEKAIEASLGAAIQNVVVENEFIAKTSINYLKKNNLGRVTFLPLNIINGVEFSLSSLKSTVKPIGIASTLVENDKKYDGIVRSLLGRVIVIDNIDNAVIFAKDTSHKYKIVTLDGEILNPGGSMTGGSLKSSGNILSRKRIIDEMEIEVNTLKENLSKILKSIKLEEEKVENIKKDRDKSIEEKNSIERELASFNTEIKMLNSNLLEEKSRLEKENKFLLEIDLHREEVTNNLDIYNKRLESLLEENRDNESKIDSMKMELKGVENDYNDICKNFNDKNIEVARLKQSFENNIVEVERITKEIQSLEEKEKVINESILEDNSNIIDLEEKIISYKKDIDEMEKIYEDYNKELEEKRADKATLREKYDEKKALFRNSERKISEINEEKYKLESKMERNKSSRDNLLSTLFEKYEMTYVQALEMRDPNLKIDQKRIDSLRRAKKDLGNVNLDSIKEYEEVKERHDYYKEQKQDLEESIVSIQELIDELVKNMEKEFVDNFNIINSNFKVVYKKLFGGGNADLKLTDSNNVLGCDIDIIAQPPGKKMKTLNLLSGGEKALTAICILFAILISKPTPFCILDEIEAPLDDVNVYRFGEYLKELSDDTQFIAVTHRRGTMEVADFIYGVTMQEKGVSSVISLKLKEAAKIAEE